MQSIMGALEVLQVVKIFNGLVPGLFLLINQHFAARANNKRFSLDTPKTHEYQYHLHRSLQEAMLMKCVGWIIMGW